MFNNLGKKIFVLLCTIAIVFGCIALFNKVKYDRYHSSTINMEYAKYVTQGTDSYEYYRENVLDGEEKEFYDIIDKHINSYGSSDTIELTISRDKANKVWDYYMWDHPEIFWYTKSPAQTAGNKHLVVSKFFDEATITEKSIFLNNVFTGFVKDIKSKGSDENKVKFILETIENPDQYFKDNFHDYQLAAAYFDDEYALTKYLLDRVNVKSYYAKSLSPSGYPVYECKVYLNNQWIDTSELYNYNF